MTNRLRLKAEDAEDLEIVSAHLQDSIAKVGDMAFLPAKRRFALVLNRFMWEDLRGGEKPRGPFRRVRSGIHFDNVMSVRAQKIRQDAKDAVLNLLSIRFEPRADGAGAVTLVFAGGGAIRLDVEAIDAEFSDISDPWSTKTKPGHDATFSSGALDPKAAIPQRCPSASPRATPILRPPSTSFSR